MRLRLSARPGDKMGRLKDDPFFGGVLPRRESGAEDPDLPRDYEGEGEADEWWNREEDRFEDGPQNEIEDDEYEEQLAYLQVEDED